MQTRAIGRTGLTVTEAALGGGPIGGLFRAVSSEDAQAALAAAWDGGIRYFDVAPHYGIGRAEREFGAFLRGRPRDEYVLSTKVGRLLVPQERDGSDLENGFDVPATHRRVWDFTRDGVRRSLEDSLERLGLDRVDILLLHDIEEHVEDAFRDGYPALAELRDEGVVRAIGAGVGDAGLLARLVRETDVDVVLLAGRLTLLDQSGFDELLPLCAERGVSVLAAAPFNSGVLASARPGDDATFDYGRVSEEVLGRARRIAEICERHGVSLPTAAMALPLLQPTVAAVVLGMRSADEVRQNLDLRSRPVPHELWTDLRDAGLLDARAVPDPADGQDRPGRSR
jgi:D-threo-aldose 1-dehydrogenase